MKNYVLKLTQADFSPTEVSGTFRSAAIDLYRNDSYKNYSTTKSIYGLDLLGNGVWTGLNQISETETESGYIDLVASDWDVTENLYSNVDMEDGESNDSFSSYHTLPDLSEESVTYQITIEEFPELTGGYPAIKTQGYGFSTYTNESYYDEELEQEVEYKYYANKSYFIQAFNDVGRMYKNAAVDGPGSGSAFYGDGENEIFSYEGYFGSPSIRDQVTPEAPLLARLTVTPADSGYDLHVEYEWNNRIFYETDFEGVTDIDGVGAYHRGKDVPFTSVDIVEPLVKELFIDTTGRIDLYGFDITFDNRVGTGDLSARFSIYFSPDEDAAFPYEYAVIDNVNASARPIEFNIDRYLVLEAIIDATENIDNLEYEIYVDVHIDGPVIAPLFASSRRMLNKFPTWTDMYKDSGYGEVITPNESLDLLATPTYVGSSLLNSVAGRWMDELEFWIKKHGIEQYIGTADIDQKTHTYLTEAALLDHIVTIKGDGFEIPRVSSLYDYHNLLEDEDGVYIDPVDGGIFSNVEYDAFTINDDAYTQTYSAIWNWFDEFGLAVDLYRLPREENLPFKKRILDVYKNQPGVTIGRFKNALRRELDLWHEAGSTPDSDYMGATPEVFEIKDLENMVEGSTPYMGYDGMATDRFFTLAKKLNNTYPILWDHFKYNQAFWDVTGFNNEAIHYLPYLYDATPVDDMEKYSPGIGAGDDLYLYKPSVPIAPIDFSADLEVRGMAKSYRTEYPELDFTYSITGVADRVEHSGPEVETNNYLQFTIDGVVYTHNVELASQSDIYFGQATPSANSFVSLTTINPDGTFDSDAVIYDDDGDLVSSPELLNVFYDLDPSTDIIFGFGYYDGDADTLVNETPIEDVRVGWMDYEEGEITAGSYIATRDSTDDGFIMPVVVNYEVSEPVKKWYSEARSYQGALNGANTDLDQLDYEHEFTDIVWDPNLAGTPNKMWLLQITSTDGFEGNPSASYLSYDNTTKYLPADNIEVTIDPVVSRYETTSRQDDYFVASEEEYLAQNEAEYDAPGPLVHGMATFNLDTIHPSPVPAASITLGVGYANDATAVKTYYVVQDGTDYILMREDAGPDVEIHTWESADQALIGIDNTTVKIDYLDTAGTYNVYWKVYIGGTLVDTSSTTHGHFVDLDKFVATLHTGASSASGYLVVSDSYIQVYTSSATASWVDGAVEIPYGTETITFSSTTSADPEYPEPDDKAFILEPFTATIEDAVEGTVDENGIWRNGRPSQYQSKYNVIDALRLARDDFGLDESNDLFISWIGITSKNNLVDVWLDTNTVKSEAADFSETINYGNSYINELYSEDLDTYYLDRILVKARLKKTVDPHWYPQVHEGFVYINGEERYMYIEPAHASINDDELILDDVVRQGAPVIVKSDHATPIELRQVAFHDATPELSLVNEETVYGSGTNALYVGYSDIYEIVVTDVTDGVSVSAEVSSTTNMVTTTLPTSRDKEYLVSYKVKNSFYVDSSKLYDGILKSKLVFDKTPAEISATNYNVTYESSKHYPATPIDVSLNPFYTTVNEGFIFVTLSDYSVATIELKVSPSKFIADSNMYSLITVRSLDVYGNPKSGVSATLSTDFGELGGLDAGELLTDADGFASFYIVYGDTVPVSGYATISFAGEIDAEVQVPVAPAIEDEYIVAASVKDGAIIADGGPGAIITGVVLDTSGNPASYAVIRYRKGRTIYDVYNLAYSSTVVSEQEAPSWGVSGLAIADANGKFTIGPFDAATPGDPGYWFVAVESQGATPLMDASTPGTDTDNAHELVGDVVYWYEYPEAIFGVEPISNQPVLPANIVAADSATPMISQSSQIADYDFDAEYVATGAEPNWLPPKWYALDKYQQFKLGIISTQYGIVDYSNYDEFHPDHKDF